MRTCVYVDAFNLYFGCLKRTPFKWLDLWKLCQILLPKNQVLHIKVFTALIKARPQDPEQPVRQQAYLRALKTIPQVSIHYGHFLTHTVRMPKAMPPHETVEVMQTNEKGSDVNLALHFLNDAYRNEFDVGVIVSNDSDLAEAVRMVKRLGKKVGVVNPHQRPSQVLLKECDFFKPIRKSALASSQLPATLQDEHGTFHKPLSW